MTRHLPAALSLALAIATAGAAEAQQPNARVLAAMAKQGGAGAPAACKAGFATGGKVGDAVNDLRSASEQKDEAKRANQYDGARQKLVGEVQKDPKNASAWLYLGRAYLYRGDLAGADSAFSKAEALAPDCKEDTQRYRQAAWVPLVNDGVDFVKENKTDSAAALFRDANTIFRGQPNAYAGLGVIYANRNETDSAITYLKQAAKVAADANLPEDRNNATLNLGIMQAKAKRYDDAIATLEQYRTWAPNDTAGAKTLAYAYRNAGKADKAAELEKQFGIAPAEVAGGDAGVTAAFNQGVEAFNAGKWQDAGKLFGQVFEKQPYNHDALLNQATAYYKAKDGPNLVTAAGKLVELEPMNEVALELLAAGYREAKQTDKQVGMVTRFRGNPVNVQTKGVSISPTNITLTMAATGREAKDAKDKPLAAAPVTLAFEFLGGDGAVLKTQEVTLPPLAPNAAHEFKVEAAANGINGWRYKVKA
jgi:tetratricopeptide (TPR) repeat protein